MPLWYRLSRIAAIAALIGGGFLARRSPALGLSLAALSSAWFLLGFVFQRRSEAFVSAARRVDLEAIERSARAMTTRFEGAIVLAALAGTRHVRALELPRCTCGEADCTTALIDRELDHLIAGIALLEAGSYVDAANHFRAHEHPSLFDQRYPGHGGFRPVLYMCALGMRGEAPPGLDEALAKLESSLPLMCWPIRVAWASVANAAGKDIEARLSEVPSLPPESYLESRRSELMSVLSRP